MAQLTKENLEKMEGQLWDVLEYGNLPDALNILRQHVEYPPSKDRIRMQKYIEDCVLNDREPTVRGFVDAVYLKDDGLYWSYDPEDAEASDEYDDDEEEEENDLDKPEKDYETFIAKFAALGHVIF